METLEPYITVRSSLFSSGRAHRWLTRLRDQTQNLRAYRSQPLSCVCKVFVYLCSVICFCVLSISRFLILCFSFALLHLFSSVHTHSCHNMDGVVVSLGFETLRQSYTMPVYLSDSLALDAVAVGGILPVCTLFIPLCSTFFFLLSPFPCSHLSSSIRLLRSLLSSTWCSRPGSVNRTGCSVSRSVSVTTPSLLSARRRRMPLFSS